MVGCTLALYLYMNISDSIPFQNGIIQELGTKSNPLVIRYSLPFSSVERSSVKAHLNIDVTINDVVLVRRDDRWRLFLS